MTPDTLSHPALPAGHRLRHPRSSDLPAVAELKRSVEVARHGDSSVTESDVHEEWSLPRLSRDRDLWVIEDADGVVVAYGVCWAENPPYEVVAEQTVDPPARGRGLSGILLDLGEARAAELARETPDGRPVRLGVWTHESDSGRIELFSRRDYSLVRSFLRLDRDLTAEIPEPSWPLGVSVLPFRRGRDEAAVHLAGEEAFRDHFRPGTMDLGEWLEYRFSRPEFDESLWFVGWDGEEAAGGVIAFGSPAGAYIDELWVRRPWRGRGLGRALLQHELAELRSRGFANAYLGVDVDNPTGALHLYHSLGFEARRGANRFFEKDVAAR